MASRRNQLVVLVCALGGLLIGFGNISEGMTSDAYLLVLSSLTRPMLWYPGNDHRYGMLVPLLAMWARSPALNLGVQLSLSAAAGLSVFFLVPRYIAPTSSWRIVGAGSSSLWLVAMPKPMLQEWLIQPYGVAMALGVGGLLALWTHGFEPGAQTMAVRAAGVAMLALGFWVHSALGLVLVPLWLCRLAWCLGPGPQNPEWHTYLARTHGPPLAIVLGFQVATMAYLHAVGAEPQYLQLAPLSSLGTAMEHISAAEPIWSWTTALVGFGCLAIHRRSDRRERATRAACLVLAAVASSIPVAMNGWVVANLSAARYFLPMLMLWQMAAALCMQDDEPGWSWASPSLAWMLSMALVTFGRPSLERIHGRIVGTSLRPWVLDADHCTALSGPYWHVWPAVLAIRQQRYDSGNQQPIYGLATRGEFTLDLLRAEPNVVVCELGEVP